LAAQLDGYGANIETYSGTATGRGDGDAEGGNVSKKYRRGPTDTSE